jgi:adenylate cyclase
MSSFARLRRRHVLRVALAWLALTWLLVAMANMLFPALQVPLAAVRWLLGGLLLALPFAMLWAWLRLPEVGATEGSGGGDAPDPGTRLAQRLDQTTLVLVLGALSLSLLHQFIRNQAPVPMPDPDPAPTVIRAPRPPLDIDPHSIAVLPFGNLSPDADEAYFADGLSEELLNVLARVPGLKVTSRSSSFVFRDSDAGAREIAARLGVAYLLSGSVRRQGEDVRISAQLTAAGEDRQVWANAYDRRLADIFAVQEDIAQAIADALASTLGVRQVEVRPATSDLEAYALYLRGRQLFAQRGANLPAARELLERAVARDPRFADAWAVLASTWYVWVSYAAEPPGEDTERNAAEAADKALALVPGHPGALAVQARLAVEAGNPLLGRERIAQALAREPNNANTWLWQGLGLFEVGHVEAAQASFREARRLDPLSGLTIGWSGIGIALRGDRARGEALLRQAHEMGWRGPASRSLFLLADGEPGHPERARRYLDWLHDDETLAIAQRELGRELVDALSDPGKLEAAQSALRAAVQAAPHQEWIVLLDVFGLTDEALALSLDPPGNARLPLRLSLWYPRFERFRAHPKFTALAEARGLLDYWREHGPPDGCRFEGPERSGALQCDTDAPAASSAKDSN